MVDICLYNCLDTPAGALHHVMWAIRHQTSQKTSQHGMHVWHGVKRLLHYARSICGNLQYGDAFVVMYSMVTQHASYFNGMFGMQTKAEPLSPAAKQSSDAVKLNGKQRSKSRSKSLASSDSNASSRSRSRSRQDIFC